VLAATWMINYVTRFNGDYN